MGGKIPCNKMIPQTGDVTTENTVSHCQDANLEPRHGVQLVHLLGLVVAQEGQVALGTFIGKVTVLATLKAGNFIQCLKPMRPSITHWVHSVVILSVWHECLPRLRHLLVPQLLGHLAAVADLVPHLTAVVAGNNHLLPQLGVHVWRSWQFKPGVSIRTA